MAARKPWVYLLDARPYEQTGFGIPPTFTERQVGFFRGQTDGLYGSTKYHQGLVNPLNVTVSGMPSLLGGGSTAGTTFGSISIAWGDRRRDSLFLAPYYWRGRALSVLRGEKDAAIGTFATIFAGVVEDVTFGRQAVSIVVRDPMLRLEKRLQPNVYAGTGTGATAEGPSDLADTPKPITLGRCSNIAPVLVDKAQLLYQFHDGAHSPASAVSGVFDQGVALASAGNFTTLAALLAWSPVAGQFATSLETGLIRLGAQPAGQVTADVDGDAGDPDLPGFVRSWDDVIRRLVKGYGGLTDSDLDLASFSAAASLNVGFYSGTSPVLIRDVVTQIADSVVGFAVFDRDGKLRIGTVDVDTPVATIRADQILDVRAERTPMPARQVRIGYKRVWQVQDATDLAGAATASRVALVTNPYRYSQSSNSYGTDFVPLAEVRTVEGLVEDVTAAASIAVRALGLVNPARLSYTVTARGHQLARKVGETVTVEYPGLGLEGGRDCVVLRVIEDLGSEDLVTLGLWG